MAARRSISVVVTAAPHPGYPFTDPLGAAVGPGRTATWLLRRALSACFALGTIPLGVTLLRPGIDTSDTAIAVVGLLMLSASVLLAVWRTPPTAVLLASFPAGVVLVSGLVAVAKPLALIPVFYIWPVALAAYFLQRRHVVANFLVMVVAFAIALAGWVDPAARVIELVSVIVAGAVIGVLIVALKERLDEALGRLRLLATRDPLTGALNRRAFQEALDAAVARAARGNGACAVAILDIDHFKRINDQRGHAAGDEALRHLVAVIGRRARAGDALGRLGGEEFGVLLDGADAGGAQRYAQDLRAALASARRDDVPPFTISVGVAELADGDGSAEGMLLAADRAMYAAKEDGRDRVLPAPGRRLARVAT
jgi:diguanylate cyclase (GGDEF)-like protein